MEFDRGYVPDTFGGPIEELEVGIAVDFLLWRFRRSGEEEDRESKGTYLTKQYNPGKKNKRPGPTPSS
jgi:hypothetical protein